MSERIQKLGPNAHGKPTSAGYYAISPRGDLVLLAPNAPLKEGWRAASQEDLDAAELRELERREPTSPAPTTKEPASK